jgi:apolipoprotein N-acyltransferase
MDHYTASERMLSASVPRQGTRTLYSRIGDLLPWTCVVSSALLTATLLGLMITSQWRPDTRARMTTEAT